MQPGRESVIPRRAAGSAKGLDLACKLSQIGSPAFLSLCIKAAEMAKHQQSVFFILLLVSVGVMVMAPKAAEATIKACSIELNPNGCTLPGCQEQCFLDHGGWGHCAHDTVAGIFHCVCYYPCP
ncbi:hypothetical protein LINGRAHAP2_LOCUS35991 [Linum grandiflorum]